MRAAIAALERILRADPSLDNIRLELAWLYLAAGSPDVAAVYAREALSSPNIPPDVAVRARELLAGAEKRTAEASVSRRGPCGGSPAQLAGSAGLVASGCVVPGGGATKRITATDRVYIEPRNL